VYRNKLAITDRNVKRKTRSCAELSTAPERSIAREKVAPHIRRLGTWCSIASSLFGKENSVAPNSNRIFLPVDTMNELFWIRNMRNMRTSYLTIFQNAQIVYHPITDFVTDKFEG
jgi:hypothetical protein